MNMHTSHGLLSSPTYVCSMHFNCKMCSLKVWICIHFGICQQPVGKKMSTNPPKHMKYVTTFTYHWRHYAHIANSFGTKCTIFLPANIRQHSNLEMCVCLRSILIGHREMVCLMILVLCSNERFILYRYDYEKPI